MISLTTCLIAILVTSVVAQSPEEGQGYYEPRVSIIEFPSTGEFMPSQTPAVETKSVLKNLRMTGIAYAGLTSQQAEDLAKDICQQGYNAAIGGGHRYLFCDIEGAKLAPNVVCGGTYQQLLKDARLMTDACHKHGLKFFLHQTSTMVDESLIQEHPEWTAVDIATGQPYQNAYGTANTCLSNEAFIAEFSQRLAKLLQESGADGLLQDEIQFFGPTLCGCPSCRDKFLADTGLTIPDPEHHRAWLYQFTEGTPYAKWLEWRRKTVNDHLVRVRAILKQANPDGVLINYLANPSAGAPYYMAGYTIDDFPNHSDVVGYECEPPRMQYLYYSPLVIAEMKYQRAIAENMQTGTFRLAYSTSPGEYLWNWCLTKTQGCGDWWIIRDDNVKQVTAPLIAWEANHDGLGRSLASAAEIGVLFSLDARDRNPTNTAKSSWLRGYVSTCNALTDRHVPYKVLVDQDMTSEVLSRKVKTLLLLNTGPMSERAITAVRQFVKDGGTLIASSGTSLYDESGKPRTDFGLADVFGFHFAGENTAANSLVIAQPDKSIGNLVGEFSHEHPYTQLKEIAPDVETLGHMVLKDGSPQAPGILARKYGRGRVLYFSGHPENQYLHFYFGDDSVEPGKLWTDKRDSRYADLISAAALSGGAPPMTVKNLPTAVVAEPFRHENGRVKGIQVRLANLLAGEIKTGVVSPWYGASFPRVLDRLPEAGKPIEISVRAVGVKQVYLISPDYESIVSLPFTITGDNVTTTLPSIERYSIVYFSQEGNVLDLCRTPLSKTIPPPRQLRTEVTLPLVSPYIPGSLTVFAGSEKIQGGSEASVFLGEMSQYIYGSRSSQTKFAVTLEVTQEMPNPLLEIGGLENSAPLKILLNDQVIFEGTSAFRYERWTIKEFPLKANQLKLGENHLVIENTGDGPVSATPWFGLSFVRLKSR